MYYECHITLEDPKWTGCISSVIEGMGWKFSAIDGDSHLGNKVFVYATNHYPASRTIEFVKTKLNEAAGKLSSRGFAVIRQKIELVIYDTKV